MQETLYSYTTSGLDEGKEERKEESKSKNPVSMGTDRKLSLFCAAVSGRAERIEGSEVMLTQDTSLPLY
jgi:hypothetical protein